MTDTQKKQLIYNPRTWDLKEFESLAAAAKDAGFTHIAISELAERSDFQGEDKDSPWCEWSALLPTIFKFVAPPGLEEAYPPAFIKRQMDFMKAKHRIVEKLDMRAAFVGQEPHWFNERVYRKHPQWRGSRADNSLRATGMYYAPNTDHPEVRELYRAGMCEMIRQCPRLDLFTFGTNDSGGFYPWDKRLFSGANGPTGYEGRDMGKRVMGFLEALRQGSIDAGGEASIFTNVHGWFTDDETHLVLRSMKPGFGVANGPSIEPYVAECSMMGAGVGAVWLPGDVYDAPVSPSGVLGAVTTMKTHPCLNFQGGGNSHEILQAFKLAMSLPAATTENIRLSNLRTMAAELYAEDVMDTIVDAWYLLDKAGTMMGSAGGGGALGGPVMLRWLTRPLVAHQELLSEDEKSYWAPYIYQSQASQPDKYLDYINCVGYQIVTTWAEAGHICCGIDCIEGTLAAAAAKLKQAATETKDKNAAAKLDADVYRVRAMRCVTLTARHFMQMGTLIYMRDEQNLEHPKTTSTGGEGPSMPTGDLGSNGLFFMHRSMRWELDNANELIELLKTSPVPLFFTAPEPSMTGPLVLEKDLLANVERKVDIMLKHWRDAEIGWYRPTLGG